MSNVINFDDYLQPFTYKITVEHYRGKRVGIMVDGLDLPNDRTDRKLLKIALKASMFELTKLEREARKRRGNTK